MPAWPGTLDYRNAVLDSKSSFRSNDVLHGSKPRSGEFYGVWAEPGGNAMVFRVATPQQHYALKCWTTGVPELAERYIPISQRLRESDCRRGWNVFTAFAPRGIKVRDHWWPCLSMEWAIGRPLDEFVANHLANSSVLNRLAASFYKSVDELRALRISHGDLQHANVLVSPTGGVRLVDYDGMFVGDIPGVGGLRGHYNYSHPQWTPDCFGPNNDRFATWVIYCSLKALALDFRLWAKTASAGTDDRDYLLLSERDFQALIESGDPHSSEGLSLMLGSSSRDVRVLAQELAAALAVDPRSTPELTVVDNEIKRVSIPLPTPQPQPDQALPSPPSVTPGTVTPTRLSGPPISKPPPEKSLPTPPGGKPGVGTPKRLPGPPTSATPPPQPPSPGPRPIPTRLPGPTPDRRRPGQQAEARPDVDPNEESERERAGTSRARPSSPGSSAARYAQRATSFWRRHDTESFAAGVFIVAVLLGAVAGGVLGGSGDKNTASQHGRPPQSSPSVGSTSGTSTSPTLNGTFTPSQKVLLAHVPNSVSNTCWPRADENLAGAGARIQCDLPSEHITVRFYQYPSARLLKNDFHSFEAYYRSDRLLAPQCHGRSTGTYNTRGPTGGEWMCYYAYKNKTGACEDWIDYPTRIYSYACQWDGNFSKLLSWWGQQSGP